MLLIPLLSLSLLAPGAPAAAAGTAAAPAPIPAEVSGECPGYPEGVDGEVLLEAALAEARATGRRVLVILGANHCPWCRALCELWFRPDVAAAADRGFVVTKVDLGHGERNVALVRRLRLDNPAIPHLVVLDANEKILTSQSSAAFEERTGRVAQVPELVVDFLKAWSGPPAPPPAH